MDRKNAAPEIGYMPIPVGFKYRDVFLHGRPRHEKYDDFWRRHPPMDLVHRAKIFSPFDALAGFDECIAGKEILYTERRVLSGEEKEELDRKLAVLRHLTRNGQEARKNRVQIRVRYFSPCMDENSSAYGDGGIYKTVSGICRKIDTVSGTITVDDHVLPIEDITDIDGELFRETAYGTGRDGGV